MAIVNDEALEMNSAKTVVHDSNTKNRLQAVFCSVTIMVFVIVIPV